MYSSVQRNDGETWERGHQGFAWLSSDFGICSRPCPPDLLVGSHCKSLSWHRRCGYLFMMGMLAQSLSSFYRGSLWSISPVMTVPTSVSAATSLHETGSHICTVSSLHSHLPFIHWSKDLAQTLSSRKLDWQPEGKSLSVWVDLLSTNSGLWEPVSWKACSLAFSSESCWD